MTPASGQASNNECSLPLCVPIASGSHHVLSLVAVSGISFRLSVPEARNCAVVRVRHTVATYEVLAG